MQMVLWKPIRTRHVCGAHTHHGACTNVLVVLAVAAASFCGIRPAAVRRRTSCVTDMLGVRAAAGKAAPGRSRRVKNFEGVSWQPKT